MPRKSFSRKCSSEHVKGIFVNFEKTPRQISKTISLRYVSHQKNNYFLRKNFFACGSYSAEVGFYFDNAAGKTLPKLRFFPSESRNNRRKCYFPKSMFFLKEFFSFSKTRGTDIEFRKILKNWTFFEKFFPRKNFNGSVECSFNKPAASFPARRPIMLGSSLTKI